MHNLPKGRNLGPSEARHDFAVMLVGHSTVHASVLEAALVVACVVLEAVLVVALVVEATYISLGSRQSSLAAIH